MVVSETDIDGFLNTIKNHRTIREGSGDFRQESVKDPSLDRHSFARGFELGIYYAIDSLCGTEWVDRYLNNKE